MGRIITSPSKIWPGTITLCDPLSIEQVMAIEDVLDAMMEQHESKFLSSLEDNKAKLYWASRDDARFIPVILQCVEENNLQNWPDNINFPASPRKESHLLVMALWQELWKIYQGEIEIPNE